MASKKLVLGIVAAIVSLVVVAAAIIILGGGTPGGPIIVIKPQPDQLIGAKTDYPKGYSHWSFGCSDNADFNQPAIEKDMSGITWRFAEWAGIDKITVTRTSTGTQPAHTITMKIGKNPVSISYKNNDDVPVWNFKDARRRGQIFSSMPNWPKDMIGVITDVTIDGAPVPTSDILQIQIEYNKHLLYNDCPL